jgi:AcrR family transcriptional regulator
MSPRRPDPKTRTALIDIAAKLLAEHGPQSLSTRRIAAEAGSSTMAVYTHFGGMSGLVREMVHEGFTRLAEYFGRVQKTDDPVADMAVYGRAYRRNALANEHLYVVMFGGSSLAGFELTDEDRQHGRYTLVDVVQCASRCIESGRFRPGDPGFVAHQMWVATHGLVTLELGGYLVDPWDADSCFETLLTGLMAGAGDALENVTRSVSLSAERFAAEVLDPGPEEALDEEAQDQEEEQAPSRRRTQAR